MTKRVLVTGASEGLGRSFAHHFAKEGYQVTGVARNRERLLSLVEELQAIHATSHDFICADLSSEEGRRSCVELIQNHDFQVLINNAGFSRFGDLREARIDDELGVMDVNMRTVLELAHAFLRKARAGDAMINLSSLTYFLPTPIQASYVASKCWVGSLSESLWYQARKRGVYVQGLCPGLTKTQFMERAAGDMRHRDLLDFIAVEPGQVVRASYRAMLKQKGPIIVPGLLNKLTVLLLRLMPRKLSVLLLGKMGDLSS